MKYQVPSDYPIRIKRLRARHGLTQSHLAEILGVSFATINRWENGKAKPTMVAWQRILHTETAYSSHGAQELTIAKEASPVYGIERPEEPSEPVSPDFSANPEMVRLVAEGERLGLGHLFNPVFATETSLIAPLPHQRVAVYEYLLPEPCLRFLLADDAGAGKTIMSGLYIREMIARRAIKRVLIIPPAGLLGNWERELRTLFGLRFHIVRGIEARSANPFIGPESDFVIVSLDTLAGDTMFCRLQEETVVPYDLVIFDEAHKLSADRELDLRVRKTERYHLAEALAGIADRDPRWRLAWHATHLLLLTATPHMGKDFPYYALWKLLVPEIFPTWESFRDYSGHLCPGSTQGRKPFRYHHFLRRTKEEMVNADGTPLYPMRISDTLTYQLTSGEDSEQELYDKTSDYLRTFYNRARILNRSAVRFAMMIFQRRLASSTYALVQSLKNRLQKLEDWIEAIRSGKITSAGLMALQRKLDNYPDVWEQKTAEEEEAEEGQEENEIAETNLLEGIVATSLAELEVEKSQLSNVLDLAERVYQKGEESKFSKLQEILQDPQYREEKIIIFTEHRDTLHFLVRRMEGLGFTEKIAQVHGGMPYEEREEQVKFFQKSAAEGGATYLIGTDAAGEGINLQFCWLMINYDIPWNPARLEQRMGRIHRYGQKHDPVVILNLVAKNTREGRVLATLLKKLETIRKELGSDKVFDCIGRLLEGISLKEYMEQTITEEGTTEIEKKIEELVSVKRLREICDVEDNHLTAEENHKNTASGAMDPEEYYHLLPGYVYWFMEKAAELLGIGMKGSMDHFCFTSFPPKLEFLLYALDAYLPSQQEHFTVCKPSDPNSAIFLRPGDPFFDKFRSFVCSFFRPEALQGGVFINPHAPEAYLFYLAVFTVEREADSEIPSFARKEVLEYRLVGIRQNKNGTLEECPVEALLLLQGTQRVPEAEISFASLATNSLDRVKAYILQQIAFPIAKARRQVLLDALEERQNFIKRGYDFQSAELAMIRARLTEKERAGYPEAKAELLRIKERQKLLGHQLENSLRRLAREPELIVSQKVTFLAFALVVPPQGLQDQQAYNENDGQRYDENMEKIAMQIAIAHEQSKGAQVSDVSTPEKAKACGLVHWPGFDLVSKRPDGEERAIEVKGRANIGNIELSTNEWVKACNLRSRYWLYVVFDCATPHPRLLRIQDPFGRLLGQPRGGVVIAAEEIWQMEEGD